MPDTTYMTCALISMFDVQQSSLRYSTLDVNCLPRVLIGQNTPINKQTNGIQQKKNSSKWNSRRVYSIYTYQYIYIHTICIHKRKDKHSSVMSWLYTLMYLYAKVETIVFPIGLKSSMLQVFFCCLCCWGLISDRSPSLPLTTIDGFLVNFLLLTQLTKKLDSMNRLIEVCSNFS